MQREKMPMQEPCQLFPEAVAILIDGDNIKLSEAQLKHIMREAERMGKVVIRHVYGNWSASTTSAWKDLVLKYAFKPCYHIHGMPGKNATDIALLVDAMDFLYLGITVFFLLSSDSDYTPLVQRLREANCQVIGVGNPAKNASLARACNHFLTLEDVGKPAGTAPKLKAPPAKQKKEAKKKASRGTSPSSTISAKKETKPFSDLELTQQIEEAYASVIAQQQRDSVLLIDVVSIFKERMQSQQQRPKDYGKNSWLFVVKARTDLFVFEQIERDGKVLDEIRHI